MTPSELAISLRTFDFDINLLEIVFDNYHTKVARYIESELSETSSFSLPLGLASSASTNPDFLLSLHEARQPKCLETLLRLNSLTKLESFEEVPLDGSRCIYLDRYSRNRNLMLDDRAYCSLPDEKIKDAKCVLQLAYHEIFLRSKTLFEFATRSSYLVGVSSTTASSSPTFNSASNRSLVGRMLLVNPHLVPEESESIISAIIHESLHSFLYRLELTYPIPRDEDFSEAPCIRSPWSSKTLSLRTYIHACFVYWALTNYWSGPGNSCRASRLHKYAEGFSTKLFRDNIEVIEPTCSEIYTTVIAAMKM